jgi:L-rhamnose mutarotase
MRILGELAINKRWLALTDPCQARLATARDGEWWSTMAEVYHLD